MKEKNILMIKALELVMIIILYYIVGVKDLFLYVLSYSLYNVFLAFFNHVSLYDRLCELEDTATKFKLFKITSLSIIVVSLLFLILSILISDIIGILFKINDTLLIFVFMGLSIMTLPLVKIMAEYIGSIKKNINYVKIINAYKVFNYIFVLLIALFVFRVFNVNNNVAIALLYLPKILIALVIISLLFLMNKGITGSKKINYLEEFREIYVKDAYKSIILIVKNSYFYISIMILYLVLGSRYGYKMDEVTRSITFIYFYGLNLALYLAYFVKYTVFNLVKDKSIKNIIFKSFKMMLSITIFLGIVSPLVCKMIFNDGSYSVYLMMINMLAIFILLFDIIYENIKNKKIIYVSLIVGVMVKLILIIPLINSFFRMGYNLVCGDVLSSIIGMFLSIMVGYIYISNTTNSDEKYFEKILAVLFDNILLCILLILIQFVIPLETDRYFNAWKLFIIYGFISFIYLWLKSFIQSKRKKRG